MSNLMVNIPLERYEELIGIEARTNAAVEMMVNDDYVNVERILRIIGTDDALLRATEIREDNEKWKKERLKEKETEVDNAQV